MSDSVQILWQGGIYYSNKDKKNHAENGIFWTIVFILRILRKMGFRYRRCNDRRKFLTERMGIEITQTEFLGTMQNIHSSGDTHPTFQLHETWVNHNHSLKYMGQDSNNRSGGL
jgi:hypothetical protein